MRLRIEVLHRVSVEDFASFRELEGRMSQISDAIAHLSTTVDSAVTRVQGDLAGLTSRVAALQAQIDGGGASPEDLAALAALQAKIDALDPAKPDVLPPPGGGGGDPSLGAGGPPPPVGQAVAATAAGS